VKESHGVKEWQGLRPVATASHCEKAGAGLEAGGPSRDGGTISLVGRRVGDWARRSSADRASVDRLHAHAAQQRRGVPGQKPRRQYELCETCRNDAS
jgi:hypothetical protein